MLRTKSFIVGLVSALAGVALCLFGQPETGAPLIATGIGTITIRHGVWKLDPKNRQPRANNGRFAPKARP